jgi:ABC-type proline/glycine betaine transport system permease subunit
MWATILVVSLAAWLIIAIVLGVIMWRRERAHQDAVLYLLAGIGGGIIMILALVAELTSGDTSNFQIALTIAALILFAAATISGLRQLKALYNNKES